jgi:alkylation response protein AidB-like acyl-CoA dehydrogenase
MDFRLSAEQRHLKETVEALARTHLRDGAALRARSGEYPWDVARRLADQGLLGLAVAPERGGQGASLLDAVLVIEAVGSVCPRSADVVQAGNFGAVRTLAEFGDDQLRARYLPGLLAGTALIGLGMTETEAGSAITDLRTTARKDGEGYVLDGSKVFTTHSLDADLFLIYARFGPGVGGIGSVVVERGSPGLTIGEPSTFMSGERWAPLYFDGCRVPERNAVLAEGGFAKQMSTFNVERLGNAARSLALGRYAFEEARQHSMVRHQFGRALCEFQGVQWMFAEMAVKLEAAQLLLYKAAAQADRGLPAAYDTAVAKAAANAAGFEVANSALQVMGATGYTQDSLVEYCVRRTRGWMIAGGSTEMLKNRIAESIFGRRFSQWAGSHRG